ncbi:LysR family transcriptional regulator [Synoicihabitans lomoniglobus]|uniref:LysR family transcriptional regulator n=1 Tax=Synoicihabitans lomoniglobus TaxID=2909285 RepID=A0AAF0CI60_9BACT|nr:LysR family transcriptional regulator [Opitutaceae bacterium LMO-M01]WED65027.1 LysR family transcriptional regulator [Opitutaceae bacterium LMO-M01]
MELQQLRYVLAIAETGNFTRAAEAAFVSQPSLSQQVAKLEDELNHKLFHRLGRRAVPTEAGAVFIERARRILFEVDNAAREIRDDPTVDRTITIGAIPTIAPYVLPALIQRCAKELPNVRINTKEAFRRELREDVAKGKLDLALVVTPLEDPRLSIEPIFTEPLVLAVGRKHRLASTRRFTARDLAEQTFIMLGESSTLTQQIQQFCGSHNFEPRIGHKCAQVASLKQLVGFGLGVAILPRLAQNPDDHETIVYRQLSGTVPTREIAVIRHLQRYQSQGAAAFLQLLQSTFRSFGDA